MSTTTIRGFRRSYVLELYLDEQQCSHPPNTSFDDKDLCLSPHRELLSNSIWLLDGSVVSNGSLFTRLLLLSGPRWLLIRADLKSACFRSGQSIKPIRADLWHLENSLWREFIHTTHLLICLCVSSVCRLDTHTHGYIHRHTYVYTQGVWMQHLPVCKTLNWVQCHMLLIQQCSSLKQHPWMNCFTENHRNHNLPHTRQLKNNSDCCTWVCQCNCNLMKWQSRSWLNSDRSVKMV